MALYDDYGSVGPLISHRQFIFQDWCRNGLLATGLSVEGLVKPQLVILVRHLRGLSDGS